MKTYMLINTIFNAFLDYFYVEVNVHYSRYSFHFQLPSWDFIVSASTDTERLLWTGYLCVREIDIFWKILWQCHYFRGKLSLLSSLMVFLCFKCVKIDGSSFAGKQNSWEWFLWEFLSTLIVRGRQTVKFEQTLRSIEILLEVN